MRPQRAGFCSEEQLNCTFESNFTVYDECWDNACDPAWLDVEVIPSTFAVRANDEHEFCLITFREADEERSDLRADWRVGSVCWVGVGRVFCCLPSLSPVFLLQQRSMTAAGWGREPRR